MRNDYIILFFIIGLIILILHFSKKSSESLVNVKQNQYIEPMQNIIFKKDNELDIDENILQSINIAKNIEGSYLLL